MIYLVGESLPKKSGAAAGGYGTDLTDFDARHGVFPNLVAKPLLSALYCLHREGADVAPVLAQLDPLMTRTDPQRRFNVFQPKGSNEPFRIGPGLPRRLDGFRPAEHLWVVYGVQTNFGLLGYLAGRFKLGQAYRKSDIVRFATLFITGVLGQRTRPDGWPAHCPTQRTARLGLLHRLCTQDDSGGQMREALREGLRSVGLGERAEDETVDRLRGMVPLLHNEAYQDRYHIGYNQAHFVLGRSVGGDCSPPELYWRVMGKALADRLRGDFVRR